MYRIGDSNLGFQGVIANENISEGSTIMNVEGEIIPPNESSIDDCFMFGNDIWRVTNDVRYLNHSENPNATFDGNELVATEDIDEGEEIFVFYQIFPPI